jgi:hypothetical protein
MYAPVKKKGQKYPNHPEDNKLIKCYCYDWSPYTAIGMFIPYKKPEKYRNYVGISRFCVKNTKMNMFESSKETWIDCEKWEYIQENEK